MGSRTWASLGEDLVVTATRHEDANELKVTLRQPHRRLRTSSVELSLDAGEETSRTFRDVTRFMEATWSTDT